MYNSILQLGVILNNEYNEAIVLESVNQIMGTMLRTYIFSEFSTIPKIIINQYLTSLGTTIIKNNRVNNMVFQSLFVLSSLSVCTPLQLLPCKDTTPTCCLGCCCCWKLCCQDSAGMMLARLWNAASSFNGCQIKDGLMVILRLCLCIYDRVTQQCRNYLAYFATGRPASRLLHNVQGHDASSHNNELKGRKTNKHICMFVQIYKRKISFAKKFHSMN